MFDGKKPDSGRADVKLRLILYEEDRFPVIRPLDTLTAVTDSVGG
jgi:hypothetical protein